MFCIGAEVVIYQTVISLRRLQELHPHVSTVWSSREGRAWVSSEQGKHGRIKVMGLDEWLSQLKNGRSKEDPGNIKVKKGEKRKRNQKSLRSRLIVGILKKCLPVNLFEKSLVQVSGTW